MDNGNDGLFDDIGPEEFGMALGFGEEIGLGEQEDREAARQNEPNDLEPISLRDYKLPKAVNAKASPARRGSFEEWMRKVIAGEIDPNDADKYPLFNDPM